MTQCTRCPAEADEQDGASPEATGLSQAEPEVSALRASIPSAVWVIIRSTGEYSDRVETPIRFCLSQEEAERAVELTSIEAQRDAHLKPPYRYENSHGYQMPDGSWLQAGFPDRNAGATFKQKPNAEAIEAQNEAWESEYEAACLALGHVDPSGSWSGDEYYCAEVTLWTASGIEARSDETQSGSSVGESPITEGETP